MHFNYGYEMKCWVKKACILLGGEGSTKKKQKELLKQFY